MSTRSASSNAVNHLSAFFKTCISSIWLFFTLNLTVWIKQSVCHPAWCFEYRHAAWPHKRLWWFVCRSVKLIDCVFFLFHNLIATHISKARIAINAAKPPIKIRIASSVFMLFATKTRNTLFRIIENS